MGVWNVIDEKNLWMVEEGGVGGEWLGVEGWEG